MALEMAPTVAGTLRVPLALQHRALPGGHSLAEGGARKQGAEMLRLVEGDGYGLAGEQASREHARKDAARSRIVTGTQEESMRQKALPRRS